MTEAGEARRKERREAKQKLQDFLARTDPDRIPRQVDQRQGCGGRVLSPEDMEKVRAQLEAALEDIFPEKDGADKDIWTNENVRSSLTRMAELATMQELDRVHGVDCQSVKVQNNAEFQLLGAGVRRQILLPLQEQANARHNSRSFSSA